MQRLFKGRPQAILCVGLGNTIVLLPMLGVLLFVILVPDAILALPRLLMPRFAG